MIDVVEQQESKKDYDVKLYFQDVKNYQAYENFNCILKIKTIIYLRDTPIE